MVHLWLRRFSAVPLPLSPSPTAPLPSPSGRRKVAPSDIPAKPPKTVEDSAPPPQRFQSFTSKSHRLFPHPPAPCHNRIAPAAGWIANVSMQAGGNAPGRARKRRCAGRGRRWSTRFRWRRAFAEKAALASHRAGFQVLPAQAGGARGTPLRACGGHGASTRQGPCRNLRPKQFPRSVRTAAGATRAEGPEEGR